MKLPVHFLILAAALTTVIPGTAQKPAIDTAAYSRWTFLRYSTISDDGRYAAIQIEDNSSGVGRYRCMLRATEGSWVKWLEEVRDVYFAPDHRHAAYMLKGDTLAIATLGTDEVIYRRGVSRFTGCATRLLYRDTGAGNVLHVYDWKNGRTMDLAGMVDEQSKQGGDTLLVQTAMPGSNSSAAGEPQGQQIDRVRLGIFRFSTGKTQWIYAGPKASGFLWSGDSRSLAFAAGDGDDRKIWIYHRGQEAAVTLATRTSEGVRDSLRIGDLVLFSADGQKVFFNLVARRKQPEVKNAELGLTVWSYVQPQLPKQAWGLDDEIRYLSYAPTGGGTVTQVQFPGDVSVDIKGEYAMLAHVSGGGDGSEQMFSREAMVCHYLISFKGGPARVLPGYLFFSPDYKYGIYYDAVSRQYCSYTLADGTTRPITSAIRTVWDRFPNDIVDSAGNLYEPCGWVDGGKWVLLHDRHDVWQVDPSGQLPPVNLTNGYGKAHDILFGFSLGISSDALFRTGQQVLLSAFNRSTKDNGFFRMVIGARRDGGPGASSRPRDPELLTMEPKLYFAPYVDVWGSPDMPKKAAGAEAYLVSRMDASESANLYFTKDLVHFTPLTDIHPEKSYEWMTSELINYRTKAGCKGQGVLYKPEHFDPAKKYPVIIFYYERKSDELHVFHEPRLSAGDINIPTFVSQGYLVFTPDVFYRVGHASESIVDYIVSAGEHIAKLPYVDAAHIGIQGHSFGGYETNCVVTHSDLFAAACSAAGPSDLISQYGSGDISQLKIERAQTRMASTLWENRAGYIENSPLFAAHKVTTPLLLQNNLRDDAVPYAQGLEFFTALRRLGKRVWMLEYKDETHTIGQPLHQYDFMMRMLQFFGHYLKGAPAPKWMTQGGADVLSGTGGLAFDTSRRTPGPGLMVDTARIALTETSVRQQAALATGVKTDAYLWFRAHARDIDSLMGAGYSRDVQSAAVYRSCIEPYITGKEAKPDWPRIEALVRPYGDAGYAAYLKAAGLHQAALPQKPGK